MSKEIDTWFTVRLQSEGFEEDFFIKVVRFSKFEKKKRNVKLSIFLKKKQPSDNIPSFRVILKLLELKFSELLLKTYQAFLYIL